MIGRVTHRALCVAAAGIAVPVVAATVAGGCVALAGGAVAYYGAVALRLLAIEVAMARNTLDPEWRRT